MTDYFEAHIDALNVKCPAHDTPMKGKRVDVKHGLWETVIKVIYVGKCQVEGCNKWFEWLPQGAIMWP